MNKNGSIHITAIFYALHFYAKIQFDGRFGHTMHIKSAILSTALFLCDHLQFQTRCFYQCNEVFKKQVFDFPVNPELFSLTFSWPKGLKKVAAKLPCCHRFYRLTLHLINGVQTVRLTCESGAAAGFKHIVKYSFTGNNPLEQKYTQTLPHIMVCFGPSPLCSKCVAGCECLCGKCLYLEFSGKDRKPKRSRWKL